MAKKTLDDTMNPPNGNLPSTFVLPDNVSEEDEQGYSPEAPVVAFASIGHKDKFVGKEKVADRGFFRLKDRYNDEYHQKEVLIGVILVVQAGRVYFKSTESQEPDCKSNDGITGTRYGECATCPYAQWHAQDEKGPDGGPCSRDNGSPSCAEVRNLFFMEDETAADGDNWGLFILVLGRSALSPWRHYDNWLKKQQRREKKTGALHHFVRVKIELEMVTKPGIDPFWVPEFSALEPLREDELAVVREQRKKAVEVMPTAVDAIKHQAEDFVGTNGENESANSAEPKAWE